MAQLKSSKVTGDLVVTGEANVGTKITVNGSEVWDKSTLLDIGTTALSARTALGLQNVDTGATANATDAQLRARSTHTGTQPVATITGLGNVATKNIGTTSNTVMAGDDARVVANTSKLGGIATGATKNATDAQLRDRATHTGTQPVSTITGLGNAATHNYGTTAGTIMAGNDARVLGIASLPTKSYVDTEVGKKVNTSAIGTAAAKNIGSNIGDVLTVNSSALGIQTSSDFINGTLIRTGIPASAAYGASFLLTIGGKAYNSSLPHHIALEGYIYNNTFINVRGVNFSGGGITNITILEDGGMLCFWFARTGYWNSFNISVVDTRGADMRNQALVVEDVVKPTSTKLVEATLITTWNSGNQLDIGTTAASAKAALGLGAIATDATKNATDAQLRARSTHTGTQPVSTITGLGNAATKNIGTAVDTVMAGDDTRVVANTTKLGGIATGATKNATDAQLRDRATHTGTQATSTITGLDTALASKANTSTQVIAGTGLTGGGTLAANRTLAVTYGTTVGTAAQGNDTRIVNAVPNSTQVIAGTGLTGGGTLAANRTLTVSYGTAAGTAAQGNDTRIVNAVPNSRTITAGTGLTGGGTLAANRTLAVTYGTAAGTAAQGNDARINNGQAAFARLDIGTTPESARAALGISEGSGLDYSPWTAVLSVTNDYDYFRFESAMTTINVPVGLTRDIIIFAYKKTQGGTEQLSFSGNVNMGNTDMTVRELETTVFSLIRLGGEEFTISRLGSGY